MACEICVFGPVVIVLWGKPELPDLDRILKVVDEAAAATAAPITIVMRVPEDAEAPEPVVRNAINKDKMPVLLGKCRAFHSVMEGSGFANTVKRSVLAAIFMASGRRKTFFVHSRVEQVLTAVGNHERQVLHEAFNVARARGLFTRSLPSKAARPQLHPSA